MSLNMIILLLVFSILFTEVKADFDTLFSNDFSNDLSSYLSTVYLGTWKLETNDSVIFHDKSTKAPIFTNSYGKARFYVRLRWT